MASTLDLGDEGNGHAFWAPVSVRTRRDGSRAVFPHFVLDRAKPGTVVVDQTCSSPNESTSYNLFAKAMIAANGIRPSIPAFLIADHRALTQYGLGMIRPGGWGARRLRRDGYVVSAPTIERLAQLLEIDAANLADSVARMNDFAQHRHSTKNFVAAPRSMSAILAIPRSDRIRRWDRSNILRSMPSGFIPARSERALALLTDQDARVIGGGHGPIPGLFAVGNDMHSIMGGAYPGPGITLGPAITFAYVAAMAAAHRS